MQRSRGLRRVSTLVNMNAVTERFVGSVCRELLDDVLVFDEGHLGSLLRQYQLYFNESRPHQGIGPRVRYPGSDRSALVVLVVSTRATTR